jgi:hypothetical protein
MDVMNQMAYEANKMALSTSLRSATQCENNESVMLGNYLDMAVANFKRAGFCIAGTDMKLVEGSAREVVMLNEGNVMVSIASVMEEKAITKIAVKLLQTA